MALHDRYLRSRLDILRASIFTVAAVAVGTLGWNGNALLLPLTLVFPALWAFSPSRLAAGLITAAYFLSASRGLPQGVMNFYDAEILTGFSLWIGASLGFVIVHVSLWTAHSGWGKTLRYGLVAIVMSVPPFGIVGWAHPITAAGVIFPGWGWWGLGAAVIGLLVITTRFWPLAVLSFLGLWSWSAATWTPTIVPVGWVGVDTQFRGAERQYADYVQQFDLVELVKTAMTDGASVVVLPESAAGIWTPTIERFWVAALQGTNVMVNLGAIVIDHDSYDNVTMQLTGEGARILYRQRMPVPVSMWQPWSGLTGQDGSARADFFANPVVEFGWQRVASLLCYEQLLVWPILHSMLYAPEIIVATGNGWWTENTAIVSIQKMSAEAWASLFGLPIIFAFNN